MDRITVAPIILALGVLVAVGGPIGSLGYALSHSTFDTTGRNTGYVGIAVTIVLGILIIGFAKIVAYAEQE